MRRLYSLVVGLMVSLALAEEAKAVAFNDLASFLAATTSVTLINFDLDPNGVPTVDGAQIGNTYASIGVTFPAGNVFKAGFGGPVSAPNGWLNDNLVGSDRVFDADFIVGGITAVGVHNVLFGSTPNGGLLRAFDTANNLLASVLSDADGNTRDFFGLTTTIPISRITINAINPSGWGLDDLYFGTTREVPEPSTLLLLGSGLVGLALWTRFKARS